MLNPYMYILHYEIFAVCMFFPQIVETSLVHTVHVRDYISRLSMRKLRILTTFAIYNL